MCHEVRQPLGVIDLGANTFHLTVAIVGAGQIICQLADAKVAVRLASTLARKVIDADAARLASAALRLLVARARTVPNVRLIGVATSALRDADNGADFVTATSAEHGLPIEVLSGEEEGQLVWSAARSEMPSLRGPIAVLDVGGGSVELAVGSGSRCSYSRSLPLGVLRLRDRHIPWDGIMRAAHAAAIARAVADQARGIAAAVSRHGPRQLLLTAGTARALGRLIGCADGLASPLLGRTQLAAATSLLLGRDAAELAALDIEPHRRDTLGPGAVAIHTFMELLGFDEARLCRHGVREGVLLREAERLRQVDLIAKRI